MLFLVQGISDFTNWSQPSETKIKWSESCYQKFFFQTAKPLSKETIAVV